MTERFKITWLDGHYRVSIPNYDGGEVVDATSFDALVTALIKIGSYDDSLASERLEKSGSYGGFDEPGSVKIAREAIRAVGGSLDPK